MISNFENLYLKFNLNVFRTVEITSFIFYLYLYPFIFIFIIIFQHIIIN